jgi:hypothetical protein
VQVYAWLHQPDSNRAIEDERLLGLIRDSYIASGGVYGSPRVFADLREAGETCGKHRIERIMRHNKIQAVRGYKKSQWTSHLISRRHLLTDGTQYLANAAGAYWLMDAAASYLDEIGATDWFVLIKVQVYNSRAVMIYEDGDGNDHARQEIAYTDFPLSGIELYACWDGEHWVIMLSSEY